MNPVNLGGTGEIEARRTGTLTEAERNAEARATASSNNTSNAGNVGNAGNTAADSVQVSERAASLAELAAKASQLPDVRAEKVEELRALIQAGNYQPSAEEIADALLRDSSQ